MQIFLRERTFSGVLDFLPRSRPVLAAWLSVFLDVLDTRQPILRYVPDTDMNRQDQAGEQNRHEALSLKPTFATPIPDVGAASSIVP